MISEKVTDDEDNPVKFLVTSEIDAPSSHIIRSYSYKWRIETFFEDSKQSLGLGDCEVRDSDSANRRWHPQMLTYSLLRLDPESNVSERLISKTSSLRAHSNTASKKPSTTCSHGTRPADRNLDGLMEEIDHLFLHSEGNL